jgi:pyruvate dehydrogenase E2 component (dihydrolipoamide acetyltransferase)
MQEGTVVRWLKGEGESVQEGDVLAEVEAAKVNEEVEAPASGILKRILVSEGTTVPVREILCVIANEGEGMVETGEPKGAARRAEEVPATASPAPALAPRTQKSVQASPRTRRLAQQLGVDLSRVQGCGPGGRVTEEDVRRAAESETAPEARVIPLAGMRRTIARRMHESLQSMAQVTLTGEADVSDLVKLREELGPEFDPTYTDLTIKAVALALKEHPRLNARIEGEEIRLLPEIHIGVAVALEDGLIVPVVRDADRKTLRQIAQETKKLARESREGSLSSGDATGSTFTVTNLGMYGVDAFTPIVNPPEVATLGIGRIVERPLRQGEELLWRQAMTLSLTFDHRVVDGAPAAAFLQAVRQRLERPELLAE